MLAGALLCPALLSGCTEENPVGTQDARHMVDGSPPADDGQRWGKQGGPCYPNNTCDPGLNCMQGKCVKQAPPDQGSAEQPGPQPEGGPPPDSKPPMPDSKVPPACSPPGVAKLMYRFNKAGDWTLAVDLKSSYKDLSISGAKPKQALATFDYNVSWQQVAGVAASRPSAAKSPAAEVTAAITALGQALYGKVSTRSAGSSYSSHDGFQAMLWTTLDVTLASTGDVGLVRNKLAAVLAGVQASQISGLPATFGAPATKLVVRLATTLRADGRVVFVGAVTDLASDNDASKNTRIGALDLTNGSALARAQKGNTTTCHKVTATTSMTAVDIIWVMDESGSMKTKRANIASNAAAFFAAAKQAGLDFRMGVTNVVNPNGTWGKGVGKFCSKISTNPNDDGGVDRFLLPSEQNIFSACINNPPGFESGAEYGLFNANKAISRHLPRAANSAGKIRSGAQVVIIVVTDEVPNSLLKVIGSSNYYKCTLPASNQASVDLMVKTHVDYFKGTKDPQSKVDYFHGIAGVCGNTCNVQVAHGYKEVAKALKGKIHDLCAKDLSGGIKQIINSILTNSAQLKLQHSPISSSLRVAVNGVVVPRSLLKGFDYTLGSNSLRFVGTAVAKGATVVASYSRWQ